MNQYSAIIYYYRTLIPIYIFLLPQDFSQLNVLPLALHAGALVELLRVLIFY